MPFYVLITLIIIGFLFTYLATLSYEKGLRGEIKKRSVWESLATGILFGSPALFLSYLVFKEIRAEDANQKHIYLIGSLVLLVIHIVVIVLLFTVGGGVIDFGNSATKSPENSYVTTQALSLLTGFFTY